MWRKRSKSDSWSKWISRIRFFIFFRLFSESELRISYSIPSVSIFIISICSIWWSWRYSLRFFVCRDWAMPLGLRKEVFCEDCIGFWVLKKKVFFQEFLAMARLLKIMFCVESLVFASAISWGNGSKKWMVRSGLYLKHRSEKYQICPQISKMIFADGKSGLMIWYSSLIKISW